MNLNPQVLRKSHASTRDCLPTFKLKQGSKLLTDHSGHALVRLALEKFSEGRLRVFDAAIPKQSGLSVGDIVTVYVG